MDKSGVVSRSALRKGIRFEDLGETLTWEDSWTENEEIRFNIDNPICTECNKPIKDILYVTGQRQVYNDAPIPVSGSDKMHFKCSSENKEHDAETYLQKSKTDPKTVGGFYSLTREDKIARLNECEQKFTEADLVSNNLAFTDFRFFLSGKFSEQPKIEDTITKAGGLIVKQTQDVTHIVLGESGRKFKNTWGEGSPAHKAALKHEPEVVSESWLGDKLHEYEAKPDEFKKYKDEFLSTWNAKKAEREGKKSEAAKKRADNKAAKASKAKAAPEPRAARSTRKRKPSAKVEQNGDDEDDEGDEDEEEDEKPRRKRGGGRKKADE